MKRIIKLTLILILAVIMIHQLISKVFARSTETPEYVIVKKIGKVEIRKYPSLILATTRLDSGSFAENSSTGFRTVARYIFGGNASGEKISMTAPVMMEMDQPMKMSFIMPSEYSREDLPKPNNNEVYLQNFSPRTMAVIRYGGYNNDERFNTYKEKLVEILESEGVMIEGDFMFFGYDPPYNIFNRRNEVAVEVNVEP